MPTDDGLLVPAEVASILRVDPKTVSRWAERGKFPALNDGRPGAFKTPGGHWRFQPAAVDIVLKGESDNAA